MPNFSNFVCIKYFNNFIPNYYLSLYSGNITVKNSTLSTGELLCPYLPPVPPQGTGVHRIVFSLYGHKEPIVYTPLNKSSSW